MKLWWWTGSLGLLILIITITVYIQSLFRKWRLYFRFGRARRLERAAIRHLKQNGFDVLEGQVDRAAVVWVNGEAHDYHVRVDYLVTDAQGKVFVAEVKSGQQAPSPTHAATRRQLLEYQIVYKDTDGVLLVDMTRRDIHVIHFDVPPTE